MLESLLIPFHISRVAYSPAAHLTKARRGEGYIKQSTGPPVSYAEWREHFLKMPLKGAGTLLVDVANSFPEGTPRVVMRHPDLVHLTRADGELYNLYVVVIHRNVTEAIHSAMRRGFGQVCEKNERA